MGTPIKKGVTTIKWGSGSTVGTPSAAIVESCSLTAKNSKPIEIEDGDGFAATLVVLTDGFDAEVTCLFDTALTWPADGATVGLTVSPANGGAGTLGSLNCTCSGVHPCSVARKKEATIKFHLTYRPGVTS